MSFNTHFATFGAALWLAATAANAAGLVEVRQTIFGMDCAPCAFGVERGLKKLPGVKDVRVSLNEGMAFVTFQPDAGASVARLREIVRHNGFTPKAAVARIDGTLRREDGDWILDAGPAGTFRVEIQKPGAPPAIGPVSLQGQVPEGEDQRLVLAK